MNFKTTLLFEGAAILECDQILGLPSNSTDFDDDYGTELCLLGFYNLKILNPLKVKKCKELDLIFSHNGKVLSQLSITSTKAIDFNHWKGIYHSSIFKCRSDFDALRLEILRTWLTGLRDISWQDFDAPNKKHSWLRACLMWRGLPEENNLLHHEVEISGNEIKCEEDLYCMLGEAFFGYGGYVGQDLTGLDECIKSIVYGQSKKLVLKIYSYQNLEKTFLNFRPHRLFEKYFLDTFENCGCTVIKYLDTLPS